MEKIIVNNMRLEGVNWCESMGKTYAFVTVEDLGREGKGFTPPAYKKYWGEADINKQPESIEAVMLRGGKWENLPT